MIHTSDLKNILEASDKRIDAALDRVRDMLSEEKEWNVGMLLQLHNELAELRRRVSKRKSFKTPSSD